MKASALEVRIAETKNMWTSTFPPSPPDSIRATQKPRDDSESATSEDSYNLPVPPPSTYPSKPLDLDLSTPDAHVLRDERLIRLTGVHPFNVEAPLSALFDSGMLSPYGRLKCR
jgi:nitrate reductase (NAD(P)H)